MAANLGLCAPDRHRKSARRLPRLALTAITTQRGPFGRLIGPPSSTAGKLLMRRVLTALAALSLTAALIPHAAEAQSGRQQGQKAEKAPSRPMRFAPLSRRAHAGPCPYVKILYDAARYVALADYERPAGSGRRCTGELAGVQSDRP